MRVATVLALLASLAALAGCGEPAGAPPLAHPTGLDRGGEQWRAIDATLGGPPDARSQNVCMRGGRECVRAVVGEMTRRLDALGAVCDHRAPFALMYLRVTDGVPGARFHDDRWVSHLDALFARLYFRAFDAWRSGRRAAVPEAWRISFEAARDRDTTGLGDMLLGMNAHISRDLAYALAEAGLRESDGTSAKVDFDAVNDLLAKVQRPMLNEESRRFDPTVKRFTSPLLGVYQSDITSVLAGWRTEAWYNAKRLLAASSPAASRAVAETIDRSAAARARLIQTATAYPVAGGSTATRDAYCLRNRPGLRRNG